MFEIGDTVNVKGYVWAIKYNKPHKGVIDTNIIYEGDFNIVFRLKNAKGLTGTCNVNSKNVVSCKMILAEKYV